MTDALAVVAAIAIQFVADTNSPGKFTIEAEPAPVGSSVSLHRVSRITGPAMFGRVERVGKALVFVPTVPLKSGEEYMSRLRLPDGELVSKRFKVPPDSDPKPIPRVLAIYPSAKVLPANLLKFYVYFSEPMRGGRAIFDRVRIEGRHGAAIESPWRRVELWNEDYTRLTLWIHPGRIKRGVNLRESMGPVLKPGFEYELVIDASVAAVSGSKMKKEFRHRFRAGEEDRREPDPRKWKLSLSGSEPLRQLQVTADESLDHALWKRHQWIESKDGTQVAGEISIGDSERSWRFRPKAKWKPGSYWLCSDQWVEDLGGNGPGRPFERLVDEPEKVPGITRRVFTVR